ncbi:MAG: hypothetical protein K2X81_20685, partial [Candidatus Obscuribacterales bacterium]|nr:hypothetical protein [Candidatus Obscuribacterales bacterium]
VGCLMYETLIGSPPMQDANDLLILSNHVHKEINSLPSGMVPKDIEKAIIKCLQKDPTKRYASADELAGKLSAARLKEPFAASRKFKTLSMAIIVLVIAATATWTYMQRNQTPSGANKAKLDRRSLKGDARPLVGTLSNEKKYQVYVDWLNDNYDYPHVDAAKMADIWIAAIYLGESFKEKKTPPHGDDIIDVCEKYLNDPQKVRRMNTREYCTLIYDMAEILLRLKETERSKAVIERLLKPGLRESEADRNFRLHKYYSKMAGYADSVHDTDLRRECTLKDVDFALKDSDTFFLRHDYSWLMGYYWKAGKKDLSHLYAEKLVGTLAQLKTIVPDEVNFPEIVYFAVASLKETKELDLICKLYDELGDAVGLKAQKSGFNPVIYAINMEASNAFELTGKLTRSLAILKELQNYTSHTNSPSPELERAILEFLHRHHRDKEILPTLLSFLSSIEKHWPMIYINTLRLDEVLNKWNIDDKQLWQHAYAMAKESQNHYYQALVWRVSAEFSHYKLKDKEALALINQSMDYFSKFEDYDDDRQTAYSIKAMILQSLGKTDEAKQVLNEGLKFEKSSAVSKQNLEKQLRTISH